MERLLTRTSARTRTHAQTRNGRAAAAAVACLFIAACSLSSYPGLDIRPDRETRELSAGVYEFLAGDFFLRNRQIAPALKHYGEALKRSGDPRLFRAAISIAVQHDHYDEAATLAGRWYRAEPDNLQLNQALFLIYMKLERYREALPHLEFSVARDQQLLAPGYSVPLLGRVAVESSFKHADALRERFPRNAAVHLLHALVAFHHGRNEDSAASSERALALDPRMTRAYRLKADALFALGRANEALELLRGAAQRHPEDRAVLMKAAAAHWRQEDTRAAYGLYQKALRLAPNDAEIIRALGVLDLHHGRHEHARGLFARLGELEAERSRSAYYLGRVAEAEEDFGKALEYYGTVNTGIFYHEARIGEARAYQRQGRTDLALAQIAAAKERVKHPHERIALFIAEAETLARAQRKADAFDVYTQALAEHKDAPDLLYSRAMLALSMDRFDVFEQDMKSLIENNPVNWRALNALGYVLADRNIRLFEARDYIRRAHRLKPDSAVVLDSMGWIEFRLNNLAAARDFLQKAAARERHPEVMGHLVEVLWLHEEREQALRVLEQALREFPGDEYLGRLQKLKQESIK